MPLSDYAVQCDNCGAARRDESLAGTEHDTLLCGSGGPGVFRRIDELH